MSRRKRKNVLKNCRSPSRRVPDVSRTTGDEATRKVAGDKKAPPFIFAFFPGMRSRYLQTPPLQSVRHPLARTHLYLTGLTSSGCFLLLLLLFHIPSLFTYCLPLPVLPYAPRICFPESGYKHKNKHETACRRSSLLKTHLAQIPPMRSPHYAANTSEK